MLSNQDDRTVRAEFQTQSMNIMAMQSTCKKLTQDRRRHE